MSKMARVVDVVPLAGHWIRVTFADGAVMEIGLEDVLAGGGIFAPIRDNRELFEQVRVEPLFGAVEWPGEIDLDSDALYGRFKPASGNDYKRRILKGPTLSRA